MNTRVGLFSGLGLGAGLMFLLDPARGRRRRALARDQAAHAVHKTGDAIGTTSRDLSHRAQGAAAWVRAWKNREPVPAEILVERVRAKLGRVVSHPGAIDVEAIDGRIRLKGPVLAHEYKSALQQVRRVRGVTDVEDRLETHEQPGDVPALQGGRPRPGERPELLQTNWAPATRVLVGAAGAGLTAYGLARRSWTGLAAGLAGAGLVTRAATNRELRRVTGIGAGRRAVDLQKTLFIDAPVAQVYTFWRNYENFPRFMTHVRDVRPTAGGSHWTIAGPAGAPIEFDAIVTKDDPDQVLAWKSVEGSAIQHAGIVQFRSERGGTRIQVRLSYNPPGGVLAHAVAALLASDLKQMLDQDLLRMKTLIETGRPPHDAARREL